MTATDTYLHPLPPEARALTPPPRFTFPFYYRPHPLAVAAARDLQRELQEPRSWSYGFGLDEGSTGEKGKMFGVLVVRTGDGELGYLAAYSGKLADSNHLPGFVPPVYDLLDESGFYRRGEQEVDAVTQQIEALETADDYRTAREDLERTIRETDEALRTERAAVKQAKADRKRKREEAAKTLDAQQFAQLDTELSAESIRRSYGLKDLTRALRHRVTLAEERLRTFTDRIEQLRELRRNMSNDLQQRIFREYTFLNAEGGERGLGSIFSDTVMGVPPAGAGECAAPKLLQFAYANGLHPVALAEFWWGQAPASEIRQHGHYYPACRGKCEPILGHMLEGLAVDPNPLLVNPARGKRLDIVYEDHDLLVVDKPHEFLSVPGKHIEDSVWLRIRQRYPEASGPLIVHRLDMSTSGLLLVAKRQEIHKKLQRQFFRRTVEKRYVALVDGVIDTERGTIDLPLRGDLVDRPRQIVCPDHGKVARTHWAVRRRNGTTTVVDLWPLTGRTHQLRVHCAHPAGLGASIVGDDLYGRPGDRLYLQADWIAFVHPTTKERMEFNSALPFLTEVSGAD
ncbi:tRNA pseudouridine32 synthase/23S rRNA pseudouridine746 synthase [Lewinella marina]|uniref:RNA pseudouridine synthase n=1 Tax=Neolewinella marina TaxID=438751 RepID=A0A2G0CHU3_9BACT|nr:pseudouridine synthase [Neolewinella marina]NJB85398.1 tRNA pseudouridine32 synthase/23S rRNA pseudouridine746 synthase [Neolewinella marina]PHK99490.1 RNA pseudouridine synthase [Neolewinella marina]